MPLVGSAGASPARTEYDWVIVGGGSAGCVLANRLSADPDVSVLMIEALGQELDDPFGHDPNDLSLSRICDTIERNLLGSSSLDLVLSSTAALPYED